MNECTTSRPRLVFTRRFGLSLGGESVHIPAPPPPAQPQDVIDRAIRGAAGAPLDNDQKATLCITARKAWDLLGQPGYAGQPEDIPEPMRLTLAQAFELWRRHETGLACGHEHLTACQQRHYPELMRHFANLAGRTNQAAFWGRRGITDHRRRALAVLQREFNKVTDVIDRPADYVGKIAATRYDAPLTDLSERQLWTLLFDLRRNAQRRRAKGQVHSGESPQLRFVQSPEIEKMSGQSERSESAQQEGSTR